MRVYYSESGLKGDKPVCLALGQFDGVHIAHSILLRKCANYASRNGLRSYAYTYIGPTIGKHKGLMTPQLTTIEEKLRLIAHTKIQNVIAVNFTPEYAETEPEDFIKKICSEAEIHAIFCGYNYRFGKGAKGDVKLLNSLSTIYGFKVTVMKPIYAGGEPISSSRIRNLIINGNFEETNRLLGRKYSVGATVERVTNDGTFIIRFDDKIIPLKGEYACEVVASINYEKAKCRINGGLGEIKLARSLAGERLELRFY